MILTCPRCAARYVVGEDQVRPQGRKVKCTACGEVWRVEPELSEPPEPYVVATPEPEVEAPVVVETAPPPEPNELRERLRRRESRSAQGRAMLWTSLVTLFTVAVLVVALRGPIARAIEAVVP